MDERDAHDAGTAASSPPSAQAGARAGSVAADDAAFSDFYRNSITALVAFLLWQGVPMRWAPDIAAEAMIQAHQHWTTIRNPRAWVRRVASRMWARRISDTKEDPVADVPEQTTSLLAITDVTAWEQRHDVLQILATLPPRQRQVLAWTMDGYRPAEIAAELKMTPEAVRASLLKARRTLATDPHVSEEQP